MTRRIADIEVVNDRFPRGEFRAAILDFDGTLSLLRRNWQDVMIPMMVDLLAATDETLAEGRVGDSTWAILKEKLDEEACIDLLLVIGAWQMVSTLLRSSQMPLDPGAESWPPDGRGPKAG